MCSVSLAEEFYTFCWVFKKDILLQNGGYPEFFKFICNIEYVLFEPSIRSLIIDDWKLPLLILFFLKLDVCKLCFNLSWSDLIFQSTWIDYNLQLANWLQLITHIVYFIFILFCIKLKTSLTTESTPIILTGLENGS